MALASLTVIACDDATRSDATASQQAEAGKRHFSQYDQITAFATAKPVPGKILYQLRIENVGSEPLVGLNETSQQWQSIEANSRLTNGK